MNVVLIALRIALLCQARREVERLCAMPIKIDVLGRSFEMELRTFII